MSSYNKNLVFTAACIGMCFFGISMITLGAVLPSLTTKLALDNLQATALVTFLPLGLLGGSLLFGPIVDRFGHKALLLLSCLVVLLGLEGIAFFTSIPLLQVSITLNPQLHSRSATYIKRNGLLIRKITIKSSRPFQCAYHPLTP